MQKKYKIHGQKIIETNEEKCPIVVYVNPDENEKRHLVENYHLDEHTLHSALDPDESSRLECEPDHVAIIFKCPKNYSGEDQLLFKAATTGAFFFGDLIIIVLREDVSLFEGKQFTKINSLQEIILRLIYRSIFHFLEHLKIINAISDEVEQKINKAMENRYLISLFTLQKSLVYYQNAINSNGVLMEKIKHNSTKIGFSQEELELLEDIIIENNQCYRQAEVYSNILAGLMDARASIVSNNLNVLMKTLNIIVIAIMVPTLVVSIFSMNVKIPFQQLAYAFWIIMGLASVFILSFFLFWRYKKW